MADLDVHPRVAVQILRHAQFALTMESYTVVSSDATREALKRLRERLVGGCTRQQARLEDLVPGLRAA